MNYFHVLILSVVEGITEFLPVSSTGHLILVSKYLGIPETDFLKSFEIFIQLGAIMAVVTLYFRKILQHPRILKPVLIAFLPTGIIGLLLYKTVKSYLLGNDMVVVISLAGVGLLLIFLERYWKSRPTVSLNTIERLRVPDLLRIGMFQAFSIIPGVSRAGATIVGGLTSRLSRADAVEFSFLLATPTMAAAVGLDLLKSSYAFSRQEYTMLAVGFIVSWIVATIVMKAFIRFVQTGTFTGFGYYRIAVAIVYLLTRSM